MDQNTILTALQKALAGGSGTLDDLDALLDRAKSDIAQAKAEAAAKAEADRKAAEANKAKRAQSIADMATRLLNDELTDEDVAMVFQSYLKSKGIDAEVSAVAVREGVERSKELENSLNELKDALGDLFGLNPVENFKYENINKNKKPEDPDDVIDSFLRKFGLR